MYIAIYIYVHIYIYIINEYIYIYIRVLLTRERGRSRFYQPPIVVLAARFQADVAMPSIVSKKLGLVHSLEEPRAEGI